MPRTPAIHGENTFCKFPPNFLIDGFVQVNNLSVNILPVGYANQGHGQSSYSSDDLPKNVVTNLSQGSVVKSMDFHPQQQTILLGTPQFNLEAISTFFCYYVVNFTWLGAG